MTYVMNEIRGDYLRQITHEKTPEEIRHLYPRFEVSDIHHKCFMNSETAGLLHCNKIIHSLNELSKNQGCDLQFNKHAIEIKKNFVITSDGATYTSDYVALCTNGEGYYKKFGLEPLVVKSVILEGDSAGLPEMFTDMTKEYNGFYG